MGLGLTCDASVVAAEMMLVLSKIVQRNCYRFALATAVKTNSTYRIEKFLLVTQLRPVFYIEQQSVKVEGGDALQVFRANFSRCSGNKSII